MAPGKCISPGIFIFKWFGILTRKIKDFSDKFNGKTMDVNSSD